MTTSERRVLELAVLGLESERKRIDVELSEIRQRLGQIPATASRQTPAPNASAAPAQRSAPNKGKKMSAAQKKKISLAMKARYAAKKKAL